MPKPEQNLDILPDKMQCPLCLGQGNISRTEVLQRLGMRDFARIAQLSAEEAIRLLLQNEKQAEQGRWAKFEVELTKRQVAVASKYRNRQLTAVLLAGGPGKWAE